MAMPFVTGSAVLLGPLPKGLIQLGGLALGTVTLGSGMASWIAPDVASEISWLLSILSLMAVSLREIWYFGFAYKQECGITLIALPLMLDADTNFIPFATPLCALGMGVLAAGKVFEPCTEDMTRSNSEFLAK